MTKQSPLLITFELEEEDLEHFRRIMRRARRAAKGLSYEQIIEAARSMIERHRGVTEPKFVKERLDGTETQPQDAADRSVRVGEG